MTIDVRSIANLVLDVAESDGTPVTNLSLNKVIYFLHVETLMESNLPLVSSKIEAWKYGPVFREIYSQFKNYGDRAITGRATFINRNSGEVEVCRVDLPEHMVNALSEKCRKYLHLTAYQLVNLSHVSGGAWDKVFNHDGKSNPGMSITNEIIKDSFAHPTFN